MAPIQTVGEPVTIPRGDDLDVHVRRLTVDGDEFIDVREYVPSAETYGRGLTLPAGHLKALQAALRAV